MTVAIVILIKLLFQQLSSSSLFVNILESSKAFKYFLSLYNILNLLELLQFSISAPRKRPFNNDNYCCEFDWFYFNYSEQGYTYKKCMSFSLKLPRALHIRNLVWKYCDH